MNASVQMKKVTIQSIELVNFMCHSNLRIDFEKMITCIGGRNGSGKSAVMIALGILFGQKAKELERGNNAKNLIKTGTNQSIIRVTLNNHRNYKKEIYGDKIIIEKKVRDSSIKTTVFNMFGKVFNLKKTELEAISDFYCLKFENPLNFLTQEASKKFLNISSPKSLYDFYYVGTEFKDIEQDLEQTSNVLRELGENITEAAQQLESIDTALATNYTELRFLEYDPEAVLKRLENEESWIGIEQEQKIIEKVNSEITDLDRQLLSLETQRLEHLKSLNITFEERNTAEQEQENAKLKIQHHGIISELEEYEKELKTTEKIIEQIRCKNSTGDLVFQIEEVKLKLENKKEKLRQLEAQKDESFRNMQAERVENQEKLQKMSNYKKQIDYLKQNAHDQNKSNEFEKSRKVKEQISKAQFKDMVIGPLYEHVSLNDHKWFKVASIVLRNNLTNFIVFNSEDKIKLYNIFNSLKVDCSVSQMKSKHGYKGLHTNKNFKTLMNVLDIGNDIVSNQLVTMHNIEQLILMENREEAHSTIAQKPSNVDCAYTVSGDQIKLVNGSLTDFRSKDDGYYWFEDKSSKIHKYEKELNLIQISEAGKKKYDIIIHEIGSITPEIEALEKKLRNLTFELEAFSNLKENDTESLEKKFKMLYNSTKSLFTKKVAHEHRINELESSIKESCRFNKNEKDRVAKIRDQAATEIVSIDNHAMILSNRKQIKTREVATVTENTEKKISILGTKPDVIRDLMSVIKERKVAIEFRQRIKDMTPKETLELNIEKLETKKAAISEVKSKFEACLEDTTAVYKKRLLKRDEIKGKNTQEAISAFKEYTARSGYEGIMTIDHESKELDLKMKVHNSKIAGSKSTLSGGERSFAGVSFLLSMWKCFKCPVKVLDEFDVFMDSLNRKTTILSLFDFFKDSNVQVILITPLDTKDLEDPDCDIKILRKEEI